MKVKVDVRYKAGHSYPEWWQPDRSLYCPGCGAMEVWMELGEGDYYVGSDYLCVACGAEFHLAGGVRVTGSPETAQVLTAIRAYKERV